MTLAAFIPMETPVAPPACLGVGSVILTVEALEVCFAVIIYDIAPIHDWVDSDPFITSQYLLEVGHLRGPPVGRYDASWL